MRILKKLVRKLYHLIWFLSIFIFFLPIVKAEAVAISNEYASGQMCSGSGSCEWLSNTNFYNGVLVSTSSTSRRPRTFGWNAQFNGNVNGTYIAKFTISFYYDYNFNLSGYWYFRDYIQSANLQFGELNGNSKNVSCTTGALERSSSPRSDKIPVTCIFDVKANGSKYYFLGVTNSSYNNYGLVPYGSGTSFTIESRTLEFSTDNSYTIINQNSTIINQNQQQIQEQKETNDKLDGIDDTLKNDDAPTIDLSDIESSDTPISDLVVLPLTLLNSIYNGISGSCSSWNLPLPFNHSYTIPCFTIGDYIGSSVTNIIDMAICLFMAYEIVLLFIRIFDDMTTLSDTYTNWVKRGRY